MPDDTNTTTTNSSFVPLPDEQSGGQTLAATGVRTIAISREQIEQFGIPEDWLKKNPALVELILTTESMKDDERKYWFQLLPIMSVEQVMKLEGILQNERDQLASLDAKYEDEVKKLNDKHLAELQLAESANRRRALEAEEAQHQEAEATAEADILAQINQL